jgi:RPA family protein
MRAVAYKLKIADIQKGKYFKSTDITTPNYIEIDGSKVFRVNLLGVVLDKGNNGFILDDGSGTVSVRIWDNFFLEKIENGDIVKVIGKIREMDQRFVFGEIVKKVANPNYKRLREAELWKPKNVEDLGDI